MQTTSGLDYSTMMDNKAENGTEPDISIYEQYGHFNVIIVSTIFSIIAFLGLVGNTMVFIAVGLSCKLHNITNAFIVNLSICDFLTCALLPFQAAAVISEDGWPLANWFCGAMASLVILTPSTSILNLTLISLNRYILITKSKKLYMKVYTHPKVAWMIALTWLFPFFFLLMPQFFIEGFGYRPKFRVCIWNSEHEFSHIFQGIGALHYTVSIILIIFSYVSIFRFVRRHMHMMAHKKDNIETPVEVVQEIDLDDIKGHHHKSNRLALKKKKTISKKQLEITKNLCVVVVAFFISTLPYTIHLPTRIYDMRGTYFGLLFVTNACINPILYAAKHPHFKEVFSCMLRCKYSDIPAPSVGLRKILNTVSSASPNRSSNKG